MGPRHPNETTFNALRPQGCLLALFFAAQLVEQTTAQLNYAVIDGVEHPYGTTWAARVAAFELQLAQEGSEFRRAAPSAADNVLVRVGDMRDRLLTLLS